MTTTTTTTTTSHLDAGRRYLLAGDIFVVN